VFARCYFARLGFTFSPVVPLVGVLFYVAIFYLTSMVLFRAGRQPRQIFSSASLTTFFLVVTLVTLAGTGGPVAWSLAKMTPSCGPHVTYAYPYEVVVTIIDTAPSGFAAFIYFFLTPGFVSAFILLLLCVRLHCKGAWVGVRSASRMAHSLGDVSVSLSLSHNLFVSPLSPCPSLCRRVWIYWMTSVSFQRKQRINELEEEMLAVCVPVCVRVCVCTSVGLYLSVCRHGGRTGDGRACAGAVVMLPHSLPLVQVRSLSHKHTLSLSCVVALRTDPLFSVVAGPQ
jgi:hypothetical protein